MALVGVSRPSLSPAQVGGDPSQMSMVVGSVTCPIVPDVSGAQETSCSRRPVAHTPADDASCICPDSETQAPMAWVLDWIALDHDRAFQDWPAVDLPDASGQPTQPTDDGPSTLVHETDPLLLLLQLRLQSNPPLSRTSSPV
jgi:hypothetical protein